MFYRHEWVAVTGNQLVSWILPTHNFDYAFYVGKSNFALKHLCPYFQYICLNLIYIDQKHYSDWAAFPRRRYISSNWIRLTLFLNKWETVFYIIWLLFLYNLKTASQIFIKSCRYNQLRHNIYLDTMYSRYLKH